MEDLEVDIDVAVVGIWLELEVPPLPRLLEVVFDLGMKTLRSEAVAPFLSPLPIIIIAEDAFVVVVVEGVIIAVVVDVVIVVGVDGGVVDATEERRRKRFIFIFRNSL